MLAKDVGSLESNVGSVSDDIKFNVTIATTAPAKIVIPSMRIIATAGETARCFLLKKKELE